MRKRKWSGRSTSTLQERAGSSVARLAVGLLTAGIVLFPFGCGQRPATEYGHGRETPPIATSNSAGSGGAQSHQPFATATERVVPNVELSLTLTLDNRKISRGDVVEVAWGDEVAVREHAAWNHTDIVNRHSRSWRAWPIFTGRGDPVRNPQVARADLGLMVIGGGATSWEESGECDDLAQVTPFGGSGEEACQYRLRFMNPGTFGFKVTWCAGIVDRWTRKIIEFGESVDFRVNVVDGPLKRPRPLH